MKPRYQATRAAIDLIKRFEGFRRKAAQLPDGRWTIGYGHTRTARAGASITEADADALLIYDVAAVIGAINEWVFSPLTQNQFDALTAFVFNIGLPNFRRSSVLRRLNEGAPLQAACAMEMWRTADFEGERIVIDALVRRRSAEMALFLTPLEGYIPVPSLIVIPRVDDAVARSAPVATAQIETTLEGVLAAPFRAGDAEPASASRAAAEAVTARLNAILQDHGTPELEPAAEPGPVIGAPLPPAEETQAEAMRAEPEPEAAVEPPPTAHPALTIQPLSAQPFLVQPLAFRARPPGSLSLKKKKPVSEPVLVLMGLAGLGMAGSGVFWGFDANATERLPSLADPQAAGLGVSLAGVALLVASVYFLLSRLAARGE